MSSKVSIIIPTFNRAHLISATLNSIKNQTYTNWECLIIDDGSIDGTQDVVNEYVAKDIRFQYHQRPLDLPKGANACRNYGFELSKGDYINWFDSDDEMLPMKLELQVDLMSKTPEAPYCICQTYVVNDKQQNDFKLRSSSISSENRFEDYILYKIFWLTNAPLWRRSFLDENHLKFDESLHQSQEYDFHIKALSLNPNYIFTNEPLVKFYSHDTSISSNYLIDENKIKSNVRVKLNTLIKFNLQLSDSTKIKLYNMLIIFYKDVLLTGNFKMAIYVRDSLLKAINYTPISKFNRLMFSLKSLVILWSYRIFGKGYYLLKPFDVAKVEK